VLCGEPRERQALLFSVAAVLSKDQSASALLLPLPFALVIVPWVSRRASTLRRGLLGSAVLGALVYGVVSGALVNPSGFRRRVAFLLGPASQTWAGYPPGLYGAALLLGHAAQAIPHFTSWPIAFAALGGIAIVSASTRGVERARSLLPLLAATSFTLLFTLNARRSEDRFLSPQALFVFPYAAVAAARAWSASARARGRARSQLSSAWPRATELWSPTRATRPSVSSLACGRPRASRSTVPGSSSRACRPPCGSSDRASSLLPSASESRG